MHAALVLLISIQAGALSRSKVRRGESLYLAGDDASEEAAKQVEASYNEANNMFEQAKMWCESTEDNSVEVCPR